MIIVIVQLFYYRRTFKGFLKTKESKTINFQQFLTALKVRIDEFIYSLKSNYNQGGPL